ncbi:hypothetical protein BJY52DRAFT_1220538 [Lactarius psammicola]|nr:hypothetical protein BJY52DRAFT_1220538 [Lactarius psammicola]
MLHLKRTPLTPPHLLPPYSGSPSNGSGAPSLPFDSSSCHFNTHQSVDPSDMPYRPLPVQPELRADSVVAQVPASRSQIPPRVTGYLPPPLSSSRSIAAASSSSLPLPPPQPPVVTFSSPTPSRPRKLSLSKSRSAFPLSASKISKATRNATTWFADAARKDAAEPMFEDEQKKRRAAESEADARATKIRTEEDHRKAAIQAKANEAVKSSIQSLLSHDIPYEWCDTVLKECDQICANGGLDLSAVLQEPIIDGKPPVYWAILNGPVTSSQRGEAALHALVLSLLDACQPLKKTTIASIRLACMSTSNNALLQHLFWNFPALSPLSRREAMLLGSTGGGDIVDVDKTRDGIGSFVAHIQIRQFRLRMRVSKLIKVEFVTSDRIWTITFSVGTENTATGRSESQWLLSFGLGDCSMPALVDGDFLVLRRLPSIDSGDNYEPAFSLPLGHNPCKLQPGLENTIKMRLDKGPMRPHLLNEALPLVDRDGTLHARFNVRLAQTRQPTLPPIDSSDGASLRSSAQATTMSTRSKPARSVKTQDKRSRNAPDKEKKVYTSLRRGGR